MANSITFSSLTDRTAQYTPNGGATTMKLANGTNAKPEYQARLLVELTDYSIANNTTTLYVELQCRTTSETYYTGTRRNQTTTIDGTKCATASFYLDPPSSTGGAWTKFASRSITVTHNSDGNKSKSINVSFTTTGSGWDLKSGSVSVTVTLPTIPRNSYTNSAPTWKAPDSVTCTINRYATFTHTVYLQLKNSSGSWETVGTLTEQATSATFSGTTVMRQVFTILDGRTSCASRFAVYTNGPGGTTYGPEGTCSIYKIGVLAAQDFYAMNTAYATIQSFNSNYNYNLYSNVGDTYSIGSFFGSVTANTVKTANFNNQESYRKNCFKVLAKGNSVSCIYSLYTFYDGVQVGSTQTVTVTCYAPAVNKVSAPNWTAGTKFTTTVTSDSSDLSSDFVLQIQHPTNSSWITIGSTSGSLTSISWDGSKTYWDKIFPVMGTASSLNTRILTTTYYKGVQVRNQTTTTGVVRSPGGNKLGTTLNVVVGSPFTVIINKSFSAFVTTLTLTARDSTTLAHNFSIEKSSSTSLTFFNEDYDKYQLFYCLNGAAEKTLGYQLITYYYDGTNYTIINNSSNSEGGKYSAPNATTAVFKTEMIAGDEQTINLNKALDAFKHTIVFKIGSTEIFTATGVESSYTFGTSNEDRLKIFEALGTNSEVSFSIEITTYYEDIIVRSATNFTGKCVPPQINSPSVINWTAGLEGFTTSIQPSRDYLYYSIKLMVGETDIQKFEYQQATSLTFANTVSLNMLAFYGLAQKNSATSTFIITNYYKKEDNSYIQIGPSKNYVGTCNAIAANTCPTTLKWTAGYTHPITISKANNNLFSKLVLKIGNMVVQEIGITDAVIIELGNTKLINTKIYQALNQRSKERASLEITTYYGIDTSSIVQVRTPLTFTGTCNSANAIIGNLTLTSADNIIDSVIVKCEFTKDFADLTPKTEVRFNNVLITTLTPLEGDPSKVTFNGETFISELYKAIPEQTNGSLEFKTITYYNEVQVLAPTVTAIDLIANENTVKVKIDETVNFSTLARITDLTASNLIDNTSMIGSKISDLLLNISKGYFYLLSKYGGYIKQIKVQIADSSEMLQIRNYTKDEIVYDLTKNKIVNPELTNTDAIVMGPYNFPAITVPGTINNLTITVTDSRNYTVSKIIALKIFPYSAPTIKLNKNTTARIVGNGQYLQINLTGTLSPLFKFNEDGETKIQTNTRKSLILAYKIYGTAGNPNEIAIAPINYGEDYATFSLTDFSTAEFSPQVLFATGNTYEIIVRIKDQLGKENEDSMIILPDIVALSFREKQIGINTIPRRLSNIIETNSGKGENPALDVMGYIYSNGREVPTFKIVESWTIEENGESGGHV